MQRKVGFFFSQISLMVMSFFKRFRFFFCLSKEEGEEKKESNKKIKTTKKKPSFFKTDKAKKGKNIFGGNLI